MKSIKKVISIFLAILTLFSICSTSTTVFAAEYTEQKARTEYFDSALSGYLKNIVDTEEAVRISEKEQVDEVVEEANSSVARTASTFSLRATPVQSTETAKETAEDLDIDHTRLTLELEDGENVAYLFSEPVSFIDDAGNLVYKDTNIRAVTDTTIINRGYSYENGDNDYKAYFSQDSSKGLLLVEKDGEEIRLVPNGTESVGTLEQIESDMELVDSFEYAGVYGTDSVLRFLPQLNGCKEEIVLSSYQGISDFSFTLYTEEGTIAAINSNGEIEIIDSATKDIITTFVAPFANDSSGGMDVTSEHYTDCTYELEMISEGKYTLTISVPEEYLESENTVYPVVIDPTTDNISMTYDTSVYSALKDSPQSSNPSACFGKTGSSEYGKGRAMFYFKIPSDIEKYAKISSATLWLREVTGRTDTMYVRPYLIKESWNNSVTWSTQPAYYSTCSYPTKSNLSLPRRNINSASTDDEDVPYWYAFNIIYAVKAWTTGTTNRGLMFIAECEASDGDYLWRGFATKEYTTSSYRPYAVIKYTNDVTKPTIESIKPNTTAWTNKPVKLTVTATDNVYKEGGISKYSFFYSEDTWQTKNYKEFTENRKVYVRVKDLAGNISDRGSYTISNYDPEKPKATITLSPTSWTNGNVTATIKMTDNAAIAKYTINGTTTTLDADGSECITSKTVTKTFSANSTVSVSVTDAAGNTCSTVSKSFTNIDKTKPSATITLSPTTVTNGSVTATIKMTDNSALASYTLDGASAVTISGTSKTITKTYSKNQTISLTVKDAAGNSYTTTKDITNIDKTKPSVTITLSPTSWTSGSVTATIKMTDNVGLKSYSLNGATAVSISGTSKIITKSYAANATINITVTDTAGNSVSASKSFTNIDKTKPSATITLSPTSWTNGGVTATIKMTDNAALANYVLDGASAVTISGTSKTITKAYSENQTISLTVTDAAGNTYSITKDINNIDKTKPSATITLDTDTWTSNVTATIKMTDNAAIAQYTIDGITTVLDADGSECITSKTITKNYSSNQTISLTVTDAAGNPYSVTKVISNIDDVLPLAEIAINPTDWTSGDVEAMITLSDNVALKSYKLGDEDEMITDGTTKTISKTYSENDTIIVEVKDAVGNTFIGRKEITNIDKNAPNVVVSSETTSVSSKITVNASDAGAGLHETAYCYNDGDWTSDNFLYVTDSTEVTIKVRDILGNTYTTTHTPEEKPEINVTIEPQEWTSDDVTVNVNGTGLAKYSLDNGESWQNENALMVCENKNITVNVTDIFGSTMCVGNYEINNIDKVAPEITDVNVSEITWTYKPVTVTVTAIDEDSGIYEYSFDGGESWQTENVKTFNKNEDEIYPETVLVMVKDTAGNTTQWDEISLVPVDVEVPASPDLYEQDGLVYISSRSFDFNEDTDSAENVEYSLDGTNWSSYEEPLNIVRTYGAKVYARVRDDAENISPIAEIELENTLGEYTASYTDIALGEGLFPVEFGRTYTSTNGWFFTFDANVVKVDDNAYVFTDFYGEKQYFIKNGEGKYLSIDDEELTINADSYVLTYGDMTCTFDLLDGKINRITTDYLDTAYTWNDNGTLTITGGATVTFTNGKPTEINITRTDSEGEEKTKVVKYEWSDNGKLTKFFDAAYSPNDTESDSIHNYAYTNGLLTTNETETITYSAEGRVKLISQPNGAFVKYTYNDNAENAEAPNNVGAVTVSDSKGVTDTWYYADGVYISNTLDSYSDNAEYTPESIADKLAEDTTDNVADVVYVVEEPQEDESADDTDAEGSETETEEPEDNGISEVEAVDESEATEEITTETPLYEEIDEDTYAFYMYDNQKRVTAELEVFKSNITDITTATFESAEAVAESKVTYAYVSDEDDSITVQTSYIKSQNGLAPDEKECYTYENGDILTHSKYKYVDIEEILLYDESYEYNDCGNVATHTETQYATDVDAFDITYTTSYTYDVWGMCTETTVACENDVDTTITEYDLNGVTLSVTYNDEKVIYTYTDFGTVDKETVVKLDGETQTVKQETDYTYDADGNLISCLNPDGDTSYYFYDDYGNLTNHNFNGYFFTYNTLGSILTASVNDDVLVTYTYEGAEQELSSVQYANGQTINYDYDETSGELLAISQGEDAKFSYSYSTVGEDEITTLTDNINNIIKVIENDKVTVKDNSEAKNFIYSVENLYEDEETEGSFNGKKITVGESVYTLKTEEDKDTFLIGETENFTKTYTDDYDGNLWKVNTANAVSTQYGYNEDKNVSTLKNTLNGLVQTFGYGYDDEGNITTETLNIVTSDEAGATVETSEAIHYEYDEDNQLLSAETADTKWAYTYDGRGNITSKTEYSVTIVENNDKVYTEVDSKVYKYEDEVWADKLTEYDDVGIEYDAVGNPTEYLGHNLEWSFGRQLTKFDTNTYTYNEDGIRTSKTVNNVTTTYYLDGTNIIEQITGDTVLHFYYDSNDEIIGFTYNEADYFYVKNAMSDIIGIVDNSGILVVNYAYDAWGKVLSVTGSNVELGELNPFRYRSYYYDSDIEMYYLQSRYYDPDVCRFINSDDVNFIGATGTVGSYNAFAYCENEPASRVDYTGTCYLNSDGKICHTNSCKDKYVPKNAINYAEKWWNKRNKDYYKYLRNGDCANFVSQCLYAGGKKMNDSWHSFWASFKPSKSRKDYDKWDYDYKKLPIRCYRVSNAWGTAKGLYKYLKKSYNLTTYKNVDKLEKAIKNKKIKVGDVAFLKNKEDGVHHAMIIGRVVNTKNKKDCYYYAHTTDRNANKNNSSVSNLLRDEEVIIFNIK